MGEQLDRLLQTVIADGRAAEVGGVLSGYLATPGQVKAVAACVHTVKSANPDALYLCDPVIGDAGRLYVDEAIAAAIRDELMPLADAATPNAFECAWLAGAGREGASGDLATMAASLPPPVVLVTSAPAREARDVGNLLLSEGRTVRFEHEAVEEPAKGTGDLLAALVLARRLQGHAWDAAAELAIASVV